jgi:branched-chain amino acid transport system permease protein
MSKRLPLYIAGFVVLYAFLIALPFGLSLHWQDFMIVLFVNVLVACSYRLMTLTGEFSLAHVVMQGLGAFGSALLAKDLGFSVWLAMPIGGLGAALTAFILSFPLFRMTLFYFLIGSFAAGEAIRLCWNYFDFPFGGPLGLKRIPLPDLILPWVGNIDLFFSLNYYYLVLFIVSICLLILYRIERSRIGLTLNAVHWSPSLAKSVGVNTWRYKTLAFVVSSFFCGIAGALLAHHLGTINPDMFGITAMIYVLIWVIVGGTTTFAGPILGVTVLMVVNEWFHSYNVLHPLFYGVILLLTMRFLPGGFDSLPGKIRDWRESRGARGKEDTGAAGSAASESE